MELFLKKLSNFFVERNITQSSIARELDVPSTYINAIFKGRKRIGKSTAKKFSIHYGLSEAWLLTGEGEMVNENQNEQTTNLINKPNVYDASTFSCGFPGGESEAVTEKSMEEVIVVPGAPKDVFYVRAHGNSMVCQDTHLSIPDGAYVALRRKNANFIQWGEVYALATRDGMVIKKILPSDDEQYIKCVSFNKEEYPEFQVRKQDIIDMAIVVGVIAMKWKMA